MMSSRGLPRTTASPRRAAKIAPLLVVLVGAVCLVFIAVNAAGGLEPDSLIVVGSAAVFTVVGALILYRTEGNRVGGVMAAIGLSLFVAGVAADLSDQGSRVAFAVGGAVWLSWFVLLGLLVYWFPTGRPASPRLRFLGWLAVVLSILAASYIVAGELCVEPGLGGECALWVDNPIGIDGIPNPEYGDFSTVGYMFLIVFVVLSAVSLVVRFIRAKGVERLQLKWFAFAVVVLIAATVAQETLVDLTPIPVVVWDVVWGLAVLGLPIAIGLSVMRYRLYEIDRIVSRTVSYALVAGLLAAVFFGVVTLLSSFLPSESDLAIAGSTLVVAALFNPLRRRVQVWVARRFHRARYDAQRVVDDLAESLRDRVSSDRIVDDLITTVSVTMQPTALAVWTKEPV